MTDSRAYGTVNPENDRQVSNECPYSELAVVSPTEEATGEAKGDSHDRAYDTIH